MKTSTPDQNKLQYSQHARIRQVQRNVTDNAVSTVMQGGEQVLCEDTKIYTDQNTKVVLSKNTKTVITVNKNTRNTRFQLSERTSKKKESLLHEINVKTNDHAMCELAELYLGGELGPKNIETAFNLFKRAASTGNSHAMCRISQLYESGDLGTPDEKLAEIWMQKAADKNNVYALAITAQKLLIKYKEQYRMESNACSELKYKILRYLNKAANKGSTRGIWHLGYIYEKGLLGEKKLPKAIEYYVKAAKRGSPSSLESLYHLTLNCAFSTTKFEEILDNVSTFLPTTSIGMAFNIGQKQLNGNLGYNPIRGLKLIEEAALKQYDEAMLKLAKCYRDGTGCEVNLKLAQYWVIKLYELYDVSAKAGNVTSLRKVAELYLNGDIDNIDLEGAELCLKKAIEISSDPDVIYNLGVLYLKGKLGNKSLDKGIKLIEKAIKIWELQAASGDERVFYDLYYTYNFDFYDDKRAVYWLCKAPNDDIDAQLCLAEMYLDNLSPEKNISLGVKILESVILKHGIDPSTAFETVDFPINRQTIRWLQDVADKITEPIADKDSNQYIFQEFVVTTLAKTYETGKLGEINYDLTCKYYNQLFVNFQSVKAANKLVRLYYLQHLRTEYYDTVKKWILEIPIKLETDAIDWKDFIDCVLILGKIYQITDILYRNLQKASKWLYVALYYYRPKNNEAELRHIKHDLSKLPPLNYNERVKTLCELSNMTKHINRTSINYKVMSRILGDIFYDNEVVDQNIDESIYWYTESANTNNGLASLKLAKIYQNDKQDIETSIDWYVLSTQQGNKDALNALTQLVHKQEHNKSLLLFLNKYQHRPSVQESELVNMKPLKNLDSYPKTIQEMYELGKSYLNLGGENNILNAAFWFREAMDKDSIDAAIELYSMYKSGNLGSNLVPRADRVYPCILCICYSKLTKSTIAQSRNITSVHSLLNDLSSVLKISNVSSHNTLNQKIETLIDQTHNINTETLRDIISDLEVIIQELHSQIKTSHALDVDRLAKESSEEKVV